MHISRRRFIKIQHQFIRFEWTVCEGGYKWSEHPYYPSCTVLTPKTASDASDLKVKCHTYRPLKDNPRLYIRFANTPPKPEGILEFACHYGLLGGTREPRYYVAETDDGFEQVSDQWYETLAAWTYEISRMRRVLDLWRSVQDSSEYPSSSEADPSERRAAMLEIANTVSDHIGEVTSASLVYDEETRKLRFGLEPDSLRMALWLQLCQAISSSAKVRQCQSCRKWIELEPGSARTDRIYCDDPCRSRAYRSRVAEAKRLYDAGMSLAEIAKRVERDEGRVERWVRHRRKRP